MLSHGINQRKESSHDSWIKEEMHSCKKDSLDRVAIKINIIFLEVTEELAWTFCGPWKKEFRLWFSCFFDEKGEWNQDERFW